MSYNFLFINRVVVENLFHLHKSSFIGVDNKIPIELHRGHNPVLEKLGQQYL